MISHNKSTNLPNVVTKAFYFHERMTLSLSGGGAYLCGWSLAVLAPRMIDSYNEATGCSYLEASARIHLDTINF